MAIGPTREQLAKLPKYAQEHIADLNRAIENQRRYINELLGNFSEEEESNTIADPFADLMGEYRAPRPLARDTTILFKTDDSLGSNMGIYANLTDRRIPGKCILELQASHGTLMMEARSANVFWLSITDRH